MSVLSVNGLTVHADSTISTNSENLLVNTSTNADGSTIIEISSDGLSYVSRDVYRY